MFTFTPSDYANNIRFYMQDNACDEATATQAVRRYAEAGYRFEHDMQEQLGDD